MRWGVVLQCEMLLEGVVVRGRCCVRWWMVGNVEVVERGWIGKEVYVCVIVVGCAFWVGKGIGGDGFAVAVSLSDVWYQCGI